MLNNHLALQATAPTPNPLRAVTLARVSSAEQGSAEKAGIPRQLEANNRVVREKGYQLVKEVILIDVSGTNTAAVAEMQELLLMAERREFDVIVASEFSRVTRPDSLSDLGLLDQFRRNGVILDIGGVEQDIQNPAGFLAGGLQAILGGYERMTHLAKINASKECARAAGRCPNGDITLPLGVCFDRKSNVWGYNEEIIKVQEAFALFDTDSSLRSFAEVGRRVGIKAPALKGILRNKAYIGVREFTQKRNMAVKIFRPDGRGISRPKIDRAPEETIRVRIIPPEAQAVSDERFERVGRILDGMKENRARVQATRSFGGNLLTGVGRCGCCGLKLYGVSGPPPKGDAPRKRGCYVCVSGHHSRPDRSNRCGLGWIAKERADRLAEGFVCALLGDEEFVRKTLEHAATKRRDLIHLPDTDDHLRSRLSEIERKDKRVVDSLVAGVLSIPEAKEARARLNEERESIHRALKAKEVETNCDMDPITARIMGRKEAWLALTDMSEKKAFLNSLFLELYILNSKQGGLVVSGFRLAPELVPQGDDVWGRIASIPVTLAEPFRIEPPPPPNPPSEYECKRCKTVLPTASFYPTNKSSCRGCLKVISRNRYVKKSKAPDNK